LIIDNLSVCFFKKALLKNNVDFLIQTPMEERKTSIICGVGEWGMVG
jgi:hypothetical protein